MGIEAGEPDAASEPGPAPAAPRVPRRRSSGSTRSPGGTRSRSRSGAARPPEAASGGASSELAQRVLAAVRSDPGKTVADYSASLGVAPTMLYRPVRELTTAGALLKRARQLFPADE